MLLKIAACWTWIALTTWNGFAKFFWWNPRWGKSRPEGDGHHHGKDGCPQKAIPARRWWGRDGRRERGPRSPETPWRNGEVDETNEETDEERWQHRRDGSDDTEDARQLTCA